MVYCDARYWPAKPVKDRKETLAIFFSVNSQFALRCHIECRSAAFFMQFFLWLDGRVDFSFAWTFSIFCRLILLLELQPVLFF